MFNGIVQYSREPEQVSVVVRPDGVTEVRLTKNQQTMTDDDGSPRYEAEEVYLELDPRPLYGLVEEIKDDFHWWWDEGVSWAEKKKLQFESPSQDERIAALEMAMLDLILGGGV